MIIVPSDGITLNCKRRRNYCCCKTCYHAGRTTRPAALQYCRFLIVMSPKLWCVYCRQAWSPAQPRTNAGKKGILPWYIEARTHLGDIEVVLGEAVHEATLAHTRVPKHEQLNLLRLLGTAVPAPAPKVPVAPSHRQESLHGRTGQAAEGAMHTRCTTHPSQSCTAYRRKKTFSLVLSRATRNTKSPVRQTTCSMQHVEQSPMKSLAGGGRLQKRQH